MAFCQGIRNGSKCERAIYRCKKCGSVGCVSEGCSSKNFDGYKCMKCGDFSGRDEIK